jgi:hypothetical protein
MGPEDLLGHLAACPTPLATLETVAKSLLSTGSAGVGERDAVVVKSSPPAGPDPVANDAPGEKNTGKVLTSHKRKLVKRMNQIEESFQNGDLSKQEAKAMMREKKAQMKELCAQLRDYLTKRLADVESCMEPTPKPRPSALRQKQESRDKALVNLQNTPRTTYAEKFDWLKAKFEYQVALVKYNALANARKVSDARHGTKRCKPAASGHTAPDVSTEAEAETEAAAPGLPRGTDRPAEQQSSSKRHRVDFQTDAADFQGSTPLRDST